MAHWTGVRSGWNARGYTPLAEQLRERRERFVTLKYKAADLLGDENYLKLVDHMPDQTTITEAIEWMQEIVKAGDLLQGYCRHTRMETDENYSMRLVGGDLIEYESMTVYCPDCGRSLLCMNLA